MCCGFDGYGDGLYGGMYDPFFGYGGYPYGFGRGGRRCGLYGCRGRRYW